MSRLNDFKQLMDRVKAGDQTAAFEVAVAYAPVIRHRARKLIEQMRLARFFDSGDICQSVLFHFLSDVRRGKFSLDNPDDLSRLLMAMVHNRVIDHARHLRAEQRQRGQRQAALDLLPGEAEDPSARPSRREIVAQARGLLSEEEWRLVQARLSGHSWEETARLLGTEPDAARMRYTRILHRLKEAMASPETPHSPDEPGTNCSVRW